MNQKVRQAAMYKDNDEHDHLCILLHLVLFVSS